MYFVLKYRPEKKGNMVMGKKLGQRLYDKILINNYSTLNDYYKESGFSQEAIEEFYSRATKASARFYEEYIDASEVENGYHILKIKKHILPIDKSAYAYFTNGSAYATLKSIEIDRINAANPNGIFCNCVTLDEYYSIYEMDNEDLEEAYKHLDEKEKIFFEECINVTEIGNGLHAFYIRKDVNQKSKNLIWFFNKTFLELLISCRIGLNKSINDKKMPTKAINRLRKRFIIDEIRFNHCETLNEFYKAYGIDTELLQEKYENVTKIGKEYFDEYIDVCNVDGKKVLKIKKQISQKDYSPFHYFTVRFPRHVLLSAKKYTNQDEETNVSQNDKLSDSSDKSMTSSNLDGDVSDYLALVKMSGIITKDLILRLNIPKKYEKLLIMEFEINQNNTFSLEEEAEFLNISIEEYCSNLFVAIKVIRNKFDLALTQNIKGVKDLLENAEPKDDGETSIKRTLN